MVRYGTWCVCVSSNITKIIKKNLAAYNWGLKAVFSLNTEVPSRIQIDCMRQAGKASVLRREFPKAEILLREALLRARDVYGENHLKYADCLVDYAFYLLNVDGVTKSVQAYEKALSVSILLIMIRIITRMIDLLKLLLMI